MYISCTGLLHADLGTKVGGKRGMLQTEITRKLLVG